MPISLRLFPKGESQEAIRRTDKNQQYQIQHISYHAAEDSTVTGKSTENQAVIALKSQPGLQTYIRRCNVLGQLFLPAGTNRLSQISMRHQKRP